MYEAQQAAQSEETLAAKQSLSEAKDEIDVSIVNFFWFIQSYIAPVYLVSFISVL